MKVKMLVGISGGRGDGTAWPPRGGEIEVDDGEGADLCRAQLAVPVAEQRKAETPEDKSPPAEERTATAKAPAKSSTSTRK